VKHVILYGLLLLAACREQGPPAPTSEQAVQRNEADAMLNSLAYEEGPADHSTGPSNSSD